MRVADNILSLIGNTPLIKIRKLNPNPKVELYAKLESFNPGGSIKDRVALAMIERAERNKELTKDKVVIEATSGNTGIGLSMVCAVKGYKIMLLMPESASEERKRIMQAFGAEIFLTPGHLGTDGAIEEAYRLAREHPDKYVLMDQFNNPASIEAHYFGTAMEIWQQTQGRVTHIVSALGTTGTAMGIAKRFRELNPKVQVIGVEPYIGHKIQGLKNMQESYPPGIFNKDLLSRIIRVEDDEAFNLCRELARKEGIFVGMSSGAALAGALEIVKELNEGVVVVIFPDGGERYLSTPLFKPVKKQGIKLFDVATKQKKVLEVSKENFCIFSPGPSCDEISSLEHIRKIIITSLLTDYLISKGIKTKSILAFPDLDDKATELANQKNLSLKQLSDELLFRANSILRYFHIENISVHIASSFKDLMLKTCEILINKGMAYEKLRSVYFDVLRDDAYGKLLKTDLSKMDMPKNINYDFYVKEHPQDFTLLKRASLINLKRGDFWSTKWGNVRPSWYLQMACCPSNEISNLSVVITTPSLYFPHLENLNAIWRRAYNTTPKIWLLVQSVESSDKTQKDLEDIKDICDNPYVIKLWLLSNHYRKRLVFSKDSVMMWENNYKRILKTVSYLKAVIYSKFDNGKEDKEVQQMAFDLKRGFWENMEDDLSLHKFWSYLFQFCKTINKKFSKKELSFKDAKNCLEKLLSIDKVLKVIDHSKLPIDPENMDNDILELLKLREKAKKDKEYHKADQIRKELQEKGYMLEDSPYGPVVYKM